MSEELTQFLASTELFSGLSLPDLARLAEHIEPVSLLAGERIIQQGDPGDCLYILQHGELEIRISDRDGKQIVLAKVDVGTSVGEIALLTGERRSASVFATADSRLLRLHQSDFEQLRQDAPDITAQFTNILVSRLQQVELQNLLHTTDQFVGMDKEALQNLEAELEVILCHSGEYLIHEGDDSDCMYIIISGRLQVTDQYGGAGERILQEVGRGQCVGEMAIITGGKRSASVRSTRDSLLARLSREAFIRLLHAHPEEITQQFAGKIINRLWLQTIGKGRTKGNIANIAVIPTSDRIPLTDFCTKLCKTLSTHGATLHLNSQILDDYLSPKGMAQIPIDDPNSVNITRWLNKQEASYRYIVYQTDMVSSEWTERCLRQADRVLLVGHAESSAKLGEIEAGLLKSPRYQSLSTSLALLHATSNTDYQRTQEWLALRDVSHHYHVFYDHNESMQRLARLLTGNGIGLVLGGGGARGFAHIGGIKALRKLGIPIDKVGGTSMGSIIAGMAALDWSYDTMLGKSGEFNYKMDYTFPAVAITAGGNLTNGLKHGFGDQCIEDSAINYFCVSTNLGRSVPEIHTQGLMWKSMRASSSIPGVYPPMVENNQLLVDGGMINNLPVDVMQAYEDIGTVIALDVSGPVTINTGVNLDGYFSGWQTFAHWLSPSKKMEGLPSLAKTLMYSALTKSAESNLHTKNLADYYFTFPVAKFGLMEFDKMHEIAETGYQYITEQLLELMNDSSFDLIKADVTDPEKR